MNLYSEVPQPLEVEMLPVLVAGSTQYQLKVDEGATICLTANGQIIGSSQMYVNEKNMLNGVASVMKNALDAQVVDLTA